MAGYSHAATVILLRDGEAGIEALLLVRNTSTSFAGGMAVFPGGRVEARDWEEVPDGDVLGAARRAAVRETREEAGMLVDADSLVPHSYWQPPASVARRFFTWFFVAPAPEGGVAVDGGEIVDHVWTRPRDALAAHAADEFDFMGPTWVTLVHLAPYQSVAEAIAATASAEPPVYQGTIVPQEQGMIFLYPGDVALTREPLDLDRPGPRRRLHATGKPWRWEESR